MIFKTLFAKLSSTKKQIAIFCVKPTQILAKIFFNLQILTVFYSQMMGCCIKHRYQWRKNNWFSLWFPTLWLEDTSHDCWCPTLIVSVRFQQGSLPIGSMGNGIFTYMKTIKSPIHVGKYTIVPWILWVMYETNPNNAFKPGQIPPTLPNMLALFYPFQCG